MRVAWILPVALPAALTAALVGITTGATRSVFSPGDLAVLTALFGLLSLALSAAAWSVSRTAVGIAAGALGLGAVWIWHLREQAMLFDSGLAVVVAAAVGAIPCALLLRFARPAWASGRCLAVAGVSAVAFVAATLGAYRASDTLRWHLLHHARVLGVPLYLSVGTPVGPIHDALWEEGGARTPAVPGVEAGGSGAGPDLVFILVDTLRADSLAAYGGDPSLMPGLNQLAEQSLVLDSLSVNASYTKSSIASMFTGLLPEEHGAVDHADRLPVGRTTLADALRQRGYETAGFVANYLNVGRRSGFERGFDHFAEMEGEGGDAYARAAAVNEAARAWLAARPPSERPLFLYLHYLDPHTPYLSGWVDPARHPDAMRRGYDAELRYTDAEVAGMVAHLKRTLGPETVFLLVSDHGEEFGEHGNHGHGHALYREVLHVPALVHREGGPRGRVDTRLEGRDLYALVPALAEGGVEGGADWARANARDRRYASQYIVRQRSLYRPDRWYTVMRSLEDGRRQLIWSAFGPTEELYDLRDDPAQRVNLRGARPEEAAALRPGLDAAVSGWARRQAEELDADTEEMLKQLGYLE